MADRMTYTDHITEASKPIAKRQETIVGRNGMKRVVRRHHLSMSAQTQILQEMAASGKFVSPYKKYSSYWGVTTALAELGENKWHQPSKILLAMQSSMSAAESKDRSGKTSWERFKGRPARSPEGLDYIARIMQNCNVLQRTGGDDPYALKLAQVGASLDIREDEKGVPEFRIRTRIPKGEMVVPLNEAKSRVCKKSVEGFPSMISFSDAGTAVEATKEATVSEGTSEVIEPSVAAC